MYFLFVLSKRLPGSYPIIAILATNLVISMTAPPSKRSPGDLDDGTGGFSNVPKILEIQLPLKIASKEDLVAWAKYVMGLMASKINITLSTVKETSSTAPTTVRNFDNVRQPQNVQSYRKSESVKMAGNIRNLPRNYENVRYAENVKNLGYSKARDRPRNPGSVRNQENAGGLLINENYPAIAEKQFVNPTTPAFVNNGVSTKSLFNIQQIPPSYSNLRISDTTIQSPLEILANINIPRSRIKETGGLFDVPQTFRLGDQIFVPQFPDFGPVLDLKSNGILRNANALASTARTYYPSTTTDNIKFPNDPFVTRYFFDGIERNVSSNLGVLPSDIMLTTQRSSIFDDRIPLPLRNVDLSSQRNITNITPLFKVPFEAVITITREGNEETTTLANEKSKHRVESVKRDPPDQFPPYLDTNYTLNESGQINVVFDDGSQVVQSLNQTRKDERRKQSKKKQSSKSQKQKKQNASKREPSPVGQFLKTFGALRKNNSLALDLSPPPLRPPKLPTPQRTMQASTERPSSTRQGRRNETSQAQELEDDDDDDDDDNDSNDNGDKNDDVESNENNENGSNESANQEDDDDDDYDDYDDEDGGGGSIKAIIDLLQLVGPILEDLSDPESDTDIADVIESAIPLLQELSEGDGETEGIDLPAVLVPVLLQLSGGEDGKRDSGAILRPLLQLLAPLIGPLSGPLIVPLSKQISHPPGQGGSNSGDLVKGLIGPLSEPAGPGQMSPFSKLIAGVVSSLSKAGRGKSDITSLVKAMVAGSIAGSSAGSSSGPRDSYGAPTSYGGDYAGGGNSYAPAEVNPFALLGSSIKEILQGILKLVASLVKAIANLLGASSNSSSQEQPTYGPPSYSPPPAAYKPPPSRQTQSNANQSRPRNRLPQN